MTSLTLDFVIDFKFGSRLISFLLQYSKVLPLDSLKVFCEIWISRVDVKQSAS